MRAISIILQQISNSNLITLSHLISIEYFIEYNMCKCFPLFSINNRDKRLMDHLIIRVLMVVREICLLLSLSRIGKLKENDISLVSK